MNMEQLLREVTTYYPKHYTTMKKQKIYSSLLAAAVLTVMTLGSGQNAHAQSQMEYSPVTWGLNAGLTVSDLWGDDVGGTTVRAGFTGGAFLNYRVHPTFSIQPEMNFTMKYSQADAGVLGEAQKTDYDLGYLEIPVLFKAHLPTQSMITPNLYAGPALSFKLYGEADGDDLRSTHNSVDFGLAFGGGIDINRALHLDLRYTLGLVDVFDAPGDPEVKNGAFQVTLGYGF